MNVDIKYRCYQFALDFIKFVKKLEVHKRWEFLINQAMRAAASVGANVVEAQSSTTKKEFSRYYEIALKSCNETKYWICLLRDGLEIKDNELNKLLIESNEISKILGKSIVTLKNNL